MAERLDLPASRNETWLPVIEYPYEGAPLPLSGAVIRLQWRLYPGAAGDPLIECVSTDADKLTFSDRAPTEEDLADDVAGEGWRILSIEPVVAPEILQALPTGLNQPEAGDADQYAWDVVIEFADGVIDRPLEGVILCEPGTTYGS